MLYNIYIRKKWIEARGNSVFTYVKKLENTPIDD